MADDWTTYVQELVSSYFVPALKPWSDAWYADQFDPPSLVYHYTSAEGLLGIVKTSSFWATHALFLNDTRELHHADELIREVLAETAAAHENEWMTAFCDYVAATPVLRYPPFTDFNVFVTCFCSDGDLLSQWRGYAGGPGGYALGVDSFPLRFSIGWPVILRKVVYEEEKQRRLVRELVNCVAEALDSLASHETSEIIPLCMQFMLARFWNVALECVYCFKDASFREENEWRLICTQPTDWSMATKVSPLLGRPRTVNYRPHNGVIVPYLELDLPTPEDVQNGPPSARSHHAIKEVVVGPSPSAALSGRSIQMLLESKGYSQSMTRMRTSTVSLRH